eukprot:4376070-Alexandrium_andersonii.AAC.1
MQCLTAATFGSVCRSAGATRPASTAFQNACWASKGPQSATFGQHFAHNDTRATALCAVGS